MLLIRRLLASLRFRLLLLVLAAAIPGMGVIVYEGVQQWKLAAEASTQHALDHAREISREQERLIQSAHYLLQALVRLTSVREHNGKQCDVIFPKMINAHPAFLDLAAATPGGDIFCSARPLAHPVNLARQPYFQRLLRSRDFAVNEDLVGTLSGKPNITIAYPARDDSGAVRAVVLVGVSLDWTSQIVAGLKLPPGSEVTLSDRSGVILSRYPEPEKWVGKLPASRPAFKAIPGQQRGGIAEAAGLDGAKRLYAFASVRGLGPGNDISVSVGIPDDIVFSAARKKLYRDVVLIGIVLALSLSGVWFGTAVFIARPVNSLVGATRRLAAGDLNARTGLCHGEGELNQLACSFDQMADSLEANITERKKAEQQVQRNLERIRALHEIDKAMTSTLDLRGVLDVLLEKIDLALPYAATSVRLFNQESGLLEPVACRNLDEAEWKTEKWSGGRGIPNVVFETGAPVIIGDVQTHRQNRDQEFSRKHGLVSYLGVPLAADGKNLGVISFYTKEQHDFSNEEVEFLTALAGQAAVAIQNSQLYEQTKKQAGQLKRAMDDMVHAAKVKDEFLSVMSHELRTPLNVIVGYTGMLKDGLLGDLNREQQQALGKIITRTSDQLALVNNVLFATVLQGEKAKMEIHKFDPGDFLKQLRLGYEASVHKKEVVLKWDYPEELPSIETDGGKLKQILQNLIDNAVKFTEKGSVTVSTRITGRPSAISGPQSAIRDPQSAINRVEFKVADTGIGIPADQLADIFDKFHQVDSSETRLHGGVGLGLYIVKQLTELLGGSVEVESELGKGSTFTLTIPLERQQGMPPPGEAENSKPNTD